MSYTNPVIDADFPDPSVIYVDGQGYYAYGTHDCFSPTINNILICHSHDLIHWSQPEGALKEMPDWAKNCNRFWAPHVVKVKDEFRLYYAAEPDTRDGMCLAMAISDTPTSFRDIGYPLAKEPGSTYQMIDPCFFTDPKTGSSFLYYGSAHEPIWVVKMADDGRSFISDPEPVLYPVANSCFEKLREGAFVTFNSRWNRYFLWVSGSNTWAADSYAVAVYWSAHPAIEFKKIPGEHIILKPNKYWDSPGQCCIIKDRANVEWMVYHAVDRKQKFIEGTDRFLRKMCMDKIEYTKDGWPFITTGSPSFTEHTGPLTN